MIADPFDNKSIIVFNNVANFPKYFYRVRFPSGKLLFLKSLDYLIMNQEQNKSLELSGATVF